MATLAKYITVAASSAFLLASFFNSKLVYNAEMYTNDPAKIESRVRDNHTDDIYHTFHEKAFSKNMEELSRFYGLIK